VFANVLFPGPLRAGETNRFVFQPEADTCIDASVPNSSFGSGTSLYVDAKPEKVALLRFGLGGIGDRVVQDARLRLYQTDASDVGGSVLGASSESWSEATTWANGPSLDGESLGALGPVTSGNWYEVDLGSLALTDGPVSFALRSSSADGARWGSRESAHPPELVVDLAESPGLVVDQLSQVAGPTVGSSDPTYYGTNHRLAVTEGGRTLVVFGRHKSGVQLAWRDSASGWQTTTKGTVSNGGLLTNSGTGDWPASIAVGSDSRGEQHAWVVWSGKTATATQGVTMRRLSDLDSSEGPTVGPSVTVAGVGLGNSKVDIGFERGPDGESRGCVSWLRRTSSSTWEVVTAWFTDLETDAPPFHDESVLLSGSTGTRQGTLVPVDGGLAFVARGDVGKLQVFRHASADPLDVWSTSGLGTTIASGAFPSAVALSSGQILATAESDTANHIVKVQRFSSAGAMPAELQLTGYSQPSIVSNGTKAWLVAVREGDGVVVSRSYEPTAGWSQQDQIEIGTEGGGNYAWPNLLRETADRLRLVVRGPSGGLNKSSVLAYQRLLF